MKAILPALATAAALTAPLLPATAAPKPNSVLATARSFTVTETDLQPNAQGKLTAVGTTHFQFQKDGKYRADLHSLQDMNATMNGAVFVCDGVQGYAYLPAKAQYIKIAANAGPVLEEARTLEMLPVGKPTRVFIDGKPALLYQRFSPATGKPQSVTKTWLDAKTQLLLREDNVNLTSKTPKTQARTIYSDWQINSAIPAAQFVFVPPAGTKEIVPQAASAAPSADPPLLAVGTDAPDFAAEDKDGKPVHLSDYKGKVVVLDFWATWCGPCQESLPHTEGVAAKFAPQGVVVLAVNVWDKHDAFEQWLPQHAAFKDITFAIDPSPDAKAVTDAYHVSGIPTQYVVGKDGKITQSFVGYDGPSDTLANAITSALKG